MTNPAASRPGGPTPDRSLAWKSGLLGASLGAVLLGWGLLMRQDAAKTAAAAASLPTASPPTQLIIVRIPMPVASQPNGAEALVIDQRLTAAPGPAAIDLPPLPPRPVFQQPVTRTRRS